MDDVTNTLDAATTAAQPSVRVRVVDATTRKTMTDEADVVFMPCFHVVSGPASKPTAGALRHRAD